MKKANRVRPAAISIAICVLLIAITLSAITLSSPAIAFGPVQPSVSNQDPREVYDAFNKCVESLTREWDLETGLWPRLRDSILSDPPEHIRSLDRQTLIDELIKEQLFRVEQLRRMKKAER